MVEPAKMSDIEGRVMALVQRGYAWHRAFFIGVNVLLTAVNLYTGAPWWALWPLVITGGLFTLHYLLYKVSIIDDDWVEKRSGDLYGRSYDQGHIDDIADRHGLETAVDRAERELKERGSAGSGAPSRIREPRGRSKRQ